LIHEKQPDPMVLAFIADQSPVPEYAYWTHFLNQETCFFNGYDKIARKKNYPVVLAYLIKVKRGKYIMKVELLSQNSSTLKENEITELYIRRLEQIITANPENWLWSHRRWKHKKLIK
jgi:Kdo2-lipid IVA lauroyltransferase/acyltransferase